jgi:predicted component of type VI protein secretion system
MAQRLLAAVKSDVDSGRLSRDDAYQRLLELYDFYEEHEQEEELDAVADVLDSFDGWSPLRAAI